MVYFNFLNTLTFIVHSDMETSCIIDVGFFLIYLLTYLLTNLLNYLLIYLLYVCLFVLTHLFVCVCMFFVCFVLLFGG